ncbi:hypothetical protein EH196_07105 [Bacillus sp. C1-1]|nr:hypothetical protein EH196_07105 [Bacillus sp. C1-1]
MAKITEILRKITTAVHGKDVRGSLRDGLDAVNKEVEDNTDLTKRTQFEQEVLDKKYKEQIADATDITEIKDFHVSGVTGKVYRTMGERADESDRQLAQTHEEINNAKIDRRGTGYSSISERFNQEQTLLPMQARGMFHLIAHRGASTGLAENTIYALTRLGKFTKGVEVDVALTSDGEAVLHHDDTVNRMTNGSGRVDQMTLAQIKSLNVKQVGIPDVKVPTLEEYLKECRLQNIKMVLLDPKYPINERYSTAVIKAITNAHMQDRVVVLCRSTSDMDNFRLFNKSLNVGFLGTTNENVEDRISSLKRNRGILTFISPGAFSSITKETLSKLKSIDVLVGGSIENETKAVTDYIRDKGMDLVLSDNVSSLKEYVEVRSYA